MVWNIVLPVAGALLGASMSSRAAQSAADTSAAASREATAAQQQASNEQVALQREMFERQMAMQEPYRRAGEQALNRLIPLATEYTPFGQQQFQQDPGYAFRLSEGMKALNQQAAARGGLMSGNALRAAQQYGQGLASQEYENAFNRYQLEREARLRPLQSLAGVGQTTAQQLGGAGREMASSIGNIYGTTASNIGNIGMQQAGVAGQAALARGSAYGGAINQLGYLTGRYLGNDQYQPTFGYSG